MKIIFLIPFVPNPRINKRISTAKMVGDVAVIYWDRQTEDLGKVNSDEEVINYKVIQKSNEGEPLNRLRETLMFMKKAFRYLRLEKPDCIHTTKTDMLILACFYKSFFRRNDKLKIIYEVSDIHYLALNNSRSFKKLLIRKILFFIEKVSMRQVENLIVTSEYFWTSYYKKIIKKEQTIFLPNTPNESVFRNYKFKETEEFTIGFIGKIRYKDQLKLLIDISENEDIKVLIAGDGPDFNEIQKYSENFKKVTIYGPYNYKKEIASLYSEIDCIYAAYDSSIHNVRIALPNRLYEAALCGVPIIASENTELGRIVKEENLGITINERNPKSLSEAIKTINSKEFINKVRISGPNYYNKYNYDKIDEKLRALYEE